MDRRGCERLEGNFDCPSERCEKYFKTVELKFGVNVVVIRHTWLSSFCVRMAFLYEMHLVHARICHSSNDTVLAHGC